MANITNTFRTGYAIQINYSINSQNIANNTTNITANVQLVSLGSSYTISSSTSKTGSITINGSVSYYTFSPALSGNQTKTVYTKTVDVPHNSDGTKTVSLAATLGINITLSGVYWGDVSTSGNVGLSTIPRTSSFSLNTTSVTIGSTNLIITINRNSISFTHKVRYIFGGINSLKATSATTSCSFVPDLDDAWQLPKSTSGTATIEVDTYNGSTYIGRASKTITMLVPSSIVPSISSFTATGVDSYASYATYGYVKGLTKCKLTASASGARGSSISSYYISGGGYSSSSSTLTTGNLSSAGTITFTVKVVDTRGRSATKTVSISVTDYSPPAINSFSAQRCFSGGVISTDGAHAKVAATYSYSSINSKNAIIASVTFKKTSATTWTGAGNISSGGSMIIGAGTIYTDSSYEINLKLSDNFSSVSRAITIPTSFAILDIKKGGKGIAIGKIAETDNMLDIGMDTTFSSYLTIPKGFTVHKANASGGTFGYLHIAQFTVVGTYVNQPIVLKTVQRGYASSCLIVILFANDGGKDPGLSKFLSSGIGFPYLHKSGTSTWDLYMKKSENYDCVDVTDFNMGSYMYAGMQVTWKNSLVTTLPSGYIGATGETVIYSDTGVVYSSSENAKDNIVPLDTAKLNEVISNIANNDEEVIDKEATEEVIDKEVIDKEVTEEAIDTEVTDEVIDTEKTDMKNLIKEGVKNASMYSYTYKSLEEDLTFIGFLGQELESQNKPFFDIIGSSHLQEDGLSKYDIRETSVIGVLWSALQDTMIENEKLSNEINALKDDMQNIKNLLQIQYLKE